MPTSKDFTYTRVLFSLFRNVLNFRHLPECRLQVSHAMPCVRHLPSWNALTHTTMHAFAKKQYILCSALHHKSYVSLPYVTSLRVSFCLASFAHAFIMLPPRSRLSSRGCSLAITIIVIDTIVITVCMF